MFVRHLPIPVPGAAPVLSGPAESFGNYQLSWSAVADATSYRLEEQVQGGSWGLINNDAATSHSFGGRSLSHYQYRVSGCSEAGCGPWSNTIFHEVRLPPPPPPENVKERNVNLDWEWGIEVSWSASSGATYYEVKDVFFNGNEKVHSVGSALSKTWNAFTDGLSFGDYFVRACNASECSNWVPAVKEKR